jgi:CheY-like chemotaxis protein
MGGSRKKVLWVDDEIEYLRSHIMFLETRGYSVIPVFSGDDAIQLVHDNPREYDIVLLDEQMPGKDGLTTLEEIKDFLPDLPVVMVTKSEEEQVMEDALGKKIDGYLTKPVNPSQILSVCKRLLDSKQIISSQTTQRFVRHYSDNRALLSQAMDAADWVRLYNNLVYWDLELERVEDEGLRQSHAGQKSDCNAAFSQYIADTYCEWMKGAENPPVFSPQVVDTFVRPLIAGGRRVYLVILECMRLDQYVALETLLRRHFDIQRHCYYSILPTTSLFARNALLSGMYPLEIAREFPSVIQGDCEDTGMSGLEKQMLERHGERLGLGIAGRCEFACVTDAASAQELLLAIESQQGAALVTVSVNSMDMLTQGRSTSALLKELAPDETAFRALTLSWFQYSVVFQILKELSRQDVTVVLTTDHGSVLCSRGTEIYGVPELRGSLRCKFGERVTSDERHSLFASILQHYNLPQLTPDMTCVMARENYYFTHPARFEDYPSQYRASFYYGGISLEEMIVPLAVMTGK